MYIYCKGYFDQKTGQNNVVDQWEANKKGKPTSCGERKRPAQ